jgi:hypothetical protein
VDPIPYWLSTPEVPGADVAETSYRCFAHTRDAIDVRLVVRRVRPTPGSQLALFTAWDYHAFVTDRPPRAGSGRTRSSPRCAASPPCPSAADPPETTSTTMTRGTEKPAARQNQRAAPHDPLTSGQKTINPARRWIRG